MSTLTRTCVLPICAIRHHYFHFLRRGLASTLHAHYDNMKHFAITVFQLLKENELKHIRVYYSDAFFGTLSYFIMPFVTKVKDIKGKAESRLRKTLILSRLRKIAYSPFDYSLIL